MSRERGKAPQSEQAVDAARDLVLDLVNEHIQEGNMPLEYDYTIVEVDHVGWRSMKLVLSDSEVEAEIVIMFARTSLKQLV